MVSSELSPECGDAPAKPGLEQDGGRCAPDCQEVSDAKQQPLKIAVVSFYLPPTDRIGASYQMHSLANAYSRSGHRVTIFSSRCEKPNDALYELVSLPCGQRNRTFRFGWELSKQDFSRFDLLHSGGDAWWALGKTKPYHICTYHGSCFAEALHIKGFRNRLRMLVLGTMELVCAPIADRHVAVSENTRKYLPFIREVIGNGIDLKTLIPGNCKSNVPSILFVGTMGYRKRGSALLEIFQREIRARIPTAELWIVREPERVEGTGVKWFGPVSYEALVKLYQEAWVFCLPSSYEGFGVPYIESMACGTAVMATPNAGALEVLQGGRFGCIAELCDLGEALIALLLDPDRRVALEREGLERAKDFAWTRIANEYLAQVSD